jgi:5-formyltetrahydrofolate cyclo-ligase
MSDVNSKPAIRRELKAALAAHSVADRHARSIAACSLLSSSPEFGAAKVVMLYLSMPEELDTASLALKCWQAGKTVVVPKVSWDQKRMMPTEITSLTTGLTVTGPGVREPVAGKPIPTDFIDLVVVPGLGFSPAGNRIGRGMGFYDRFLSQPNFCGVSCGLAFELQVLATLPVLEHDVPLSMLVTEQGIRRFATNCIQS